MSSKFKDPGIANHSVGPGVTGVLPLANLSPSAVADSVLTSNAATPTWTAKPQVQTFYYSGRIVPADISANKNDYLPIDGTTSQSFHDVMQISVSATGAFDITGFDEGITGEPKVFTNRGTNTITFKHNSGSSSVNNRIWCPNATDFAVLAKQSVQLYYSQPDNKWVVVGPTAGSASAITALTGDVTATGPGSVAATIANSAVTLAKIANASANSKLVGSGSSGSGAAYSEISVGSGLTMSGTTLSVSASGPFTATLKLNTSQIDNLNGTPITVIPALGSNLIAIPVTFSVATTRSGAWSASGTGWRIQYNGRTQSLTTTNPAAQWNTAAGSNVFHAPTAQTSGITGDIANANTAVEVTLVTDTNPGGQTGTAWIVVQYIVMDVT